MCAGVDKLAKKQPLRGLAPKRSCSFVVSSCVGLEILEGPWQRPGTGEVVLAATAAFLVETSRPHEAMPAGGREPDLELGVSLLLNRELRKHKESVRTW